MTHKSDFAHKVVVFLGRSEISQEKEDFFRKKQLENEAKRE